MMSGVRRKRADGVILALAFAAVIAAGIPACAGKEDRIREAFRGFKGRYVLYVTKSRFLLEVFDRSCAKVASYTIAYGSAPDGGPKLHEGDNRTPEGIYRDISLPGSDCRPHVALDRRPGRTHRR